CHRGHPAPVSDADAPRAVLLDTCAVIWLVNAGPLTPRVIDLIRYAGRTDGVHVSTASAWEVGLLSRPRRKPMPDFHPDPKTWFARLLALPGMKHAALTPEIAIGSVLLPGD